MSTRRARVRSLRSVRRLAFGASGAVSLAVLVLACGSRTGLFDTENGLGFGANIDGGADAKRDARAGRDGDDGDFDAGLDATKLPPIDANPPPDATVDRTDCEDAATQLVYLISSDNTLLSFDPSSSSFTALGRIACPTSGVFSSTTPFSMAVNRKGSAYVVFSQPTDSLGSPLAPGGELFIVGLGGTSKAACTATSYVPGQLDFATFGMGFATNNSVNPPVDTLYIADDSNPGRLGFIDVDNNFTVHDVGPFSPITNGAELTGTGDGRLFAFYGDDPRNETETHIGQIDPATASVVAQTTIPNSTRGGGWAFAFWGGDFYTFTAPNAFTTGDSTTVVTRVRPSDGSIQVVTQIGNTIVGAGVSTCAPAQ